MAPSVAPSVATSVLVDRYPGGQTPTGVRLNETIYTLLQHRSVRGYKPDALPAGTLETLVMAAQSAATSSNLQTWSVIAVTDADAKAACAALAGGQGQIAQCPLFLLFLADLSRLNRVADQVDLPRAGNDWLEMFLVAAIDASLAAQNAAIAAESLGLGTVYIGAMRNKPEEVAALFGLPEACVAVFGLCVGYASEGHEGSIKPRLPQSTVLHLGRYDTAPERSAISDYDGAMAVFYEREGMNVKTPWTVHSARRVSGPESLSGRHELMPALRRMGFLKAEA